MRKIEFKKFVKEAIKGIALIIAVALFMAATISLGSVVAHGAEIPEITQPCGLSEEELASKLQYELVQYAGDFLAAEEKHGVNAAFLAAIASLESGHGRYMFRANNIFGWGGKDFESVPECIDYVAEKLATNYLDPDGKYYRGGTIADIGKVYCPGNDEWVNKVSGIYKNFFEKTSETDEKSLEKVELFESKEIENEEPYEIYVIIIIVRNVE